MQNGDGRISREEAPEFKRQMASRMKVALRLFVLQLGQRRRQPGGGHLKAPGQDVCGVMKDFCWPSEDSVASTCSATDP